MGAQGEPVQQVPGAQQGADRIEPAGKGVAEDGRIRPDGLMLEGEQLAGAAQP